MITVLAGGKAAAVAAPILLAATQAASSSGIDPLSIISTAAQVAFLILFVTGRIVTGKTADEQRTRAEAAEKQLATLNEQMSDKVIPALTLSTHALDQLGPFLQAEIAIRGVQTHTAPRGT